MKDQDKTVGQLMRDLQDQRDEIAALERSAAELKQSRKSLTELLEIHELLTELCMQFVDFSDDKDKVDGRIEYSLKRLGEVLGHDRTSLRRYVQEGSQLVATHWWTADGVKFPPKALRNSKVPYLIHTLMCGKVFVFSTLKDLPTNAHADREWFETIGQKSALAVPLRCAGSVIGGMTFSCFAAERNWSHPLIRRLELFGKIVANAIAQRDAIAELSTGHWKRQGHQTDPHDETTLCSKKTCRRKRSNEIVGTGRAISRVLAAAEQVAGTAATVLIAGETGTGKGLLAEAIHALSSRKSRPMVTVNCSAIPSTLIESELFGRERGAFTGACSKEIGRFELADGSTLFLDEIGDLPLDQQPRLLRVIQDGRFERIGSPRTVEVDARIIAATNKDLAQACTAGRFRKDLYYRLNVFPIVLPPLRSRCEDIPDLVWTFVKEFEIRMGKHIDQIPPSSMKRLQDYHWPGNIRELRNTIERAMILSVGATLNVAPPRGSESESLQEDAGELAMEEIEKKHILKVLAATGGRVKGNGGAAEILQMNPSTLFSRMRKLGISPTPLRVISRTECDMSHEPSEDVPSPSRSGQHIFNNS
ncbi:MAG: sigma 54-interacting transcriptional regulator [Pseudomonadota bacterium]